MKDHSRWVEVSPEMLAKLRDWSEPIRVRIVATDGMLEMEFRTDDDEIAKLREHIERLTNSFQGQKVQTEYHQAVEHRLEAHQKLLVEALDRAGNRLAQVQPGVTASWALDIIPKAEQEIADVIAKVEGKR